jgi:HEAT repeat protein/photosystem II stability/assembly factor-like uncharacterized protein
MNKSRLKRTFRWILSVTLVVTGLSVTWAWGRVARLAEPPPEDTAAQVTVLYAAWQPSAAEQVSLFRSTDEGASWQPLTLPQGAMPVTWAADGNERLAVFSSQGSVLLSADQGNTWTPIETDLPIPSLVWGENGNLYLGTDGYGLFRLTADGSLASLAAPGSELASSPLNKLAYVDSRLFAATPSVLFFSDDGGETWAKSLPVAGGRISELAATGRDTVFVGTETNGVSVSTDGGRTWRPALEGLGLAAGQLVSITALRADPLEPGVLYAAVDYLVGATEVHASAAGTFVTVDNGTQWQPLDGPTFPAAQHASALVVPVGKPLQVQAVTQSGVQLYGPDVEGALAALESGDAHARMNAIRILGMARAERAGQALLAAVADADPAISMAAAEALGRIVDPATTSGLLVALEHPNEQVRLAAARALGMMGVEAAVQPLRAMLLNGDGAAVSTAAEALGRIGGPAATDALLATLADPEMTPRRHASLAALESIGEAAVGPLQEVLTGADPYARANSAEALGWIGSPSATEVLVQALGDRSSLVRSQAARALGEIGDPTARTALERVQRRDSSAAVQAQAGRALVRIEQEPIRTGTWLASLAPTLNRLQALRWLILAMSMVGAAWLAATNRRLVTSPAPQRLSRR